MKPPVNLEALMQEWSNDAPVNETDPQKSMARIPVLHAKYVNIRTHHNLLVKRIMSEYQMRRKIKWEYYNGDLNNPEDLQTYNLEPMTKKVMRADIPMWLDADSELNNLLLKKVVHEEIVDYCDKVIKELNNRTFQLRSYMDWERYIGGK